MTGAILAGGRAARYDGLPKGLQLVAGQRILDRVARSLRPVTSRLLVISNDARAGTWLPGGEVAADVLPGRASLIGIHAALAHSGTDVIVVAWDMPFVPSGLLDALRTRLARGATAVIPFGPKGPEPACAAYAKSSLAHIERLIKAGSLKLSNLVDALPDVERLPAEDVAQFGDPDAIFFNVNTPEDLIRAEAIAAAL